MEISAAAAGRVVRRAQPDQFGAERDGALDLAPGALDQLRFLRGRLHGVRQLVEGGGEGGALLSELVGEGRIAGQRETTRRALDGARQRTRVRNAFEDAERAIDRINLAA